MRIPLVPTAARLTVTAAAIVLCVHGAWVLDWADEFDGSLINSTNWNVLDDAPMGKPPTWNQIEIYRASNVYIESGALVLRTRLDNYTFDGYTFNVSSGRVDTSFKRNMTAGQRVEVSARLQLDSAASGIHTAHWLLGYGCWPICSEIDIMECQSPGNLYHGTEGEGPAPGADLYQIVTSAYHVGDSCGNETRHTTGGSRYPSAAIPGLNFTSDYTRFAVEWTATNITYFVNDTLVNAVYPGMPGWSGPWRMPAGPMFLILSQAYMAHRPKGDPPAWAWPIEQRIDYVRTYSWA